MGAGVRSRNLVVSGANSMGGVGVGEGSEGQQEQQEQGHNVEE